MCSRITFITAAVGVIHSSRITSTAIRVVMPSHIRRRAVRVSMTSRGPHCGKKLTKTAEIRCPSTQSESQRQKNSPNHKAHPFQGVVATGVAS